jgi:hypothetical protein
MCSKCMRSFNTPKRNADSGKTKFPVELLCERLASQDEEAVPERITLTLARKAGEGMVPSASPCAYCLSPVAYPMTCVA